MDRGCITINMSPGRGETQVAAALKKTPTIPESQPSITEESSSPKAALLPDERSTSDREKGTKPKRPPPRERTTPDKTQEAVKRKKKVPLIPGKKKVEKQ